MSILVVPASGDDESSCEVCHSKIAVAYEESAHQQADITCVDCHGGDPRDMDVTAMSHGEDFKGLRSRAKIPQFCAGCHSDRALMRQYGLSTHQYDDYRTSQHGQSWQTGNTDVAVCTDCHGQHRILPLDDPRSMVAMPNIPSTCGRCHSDEKMMAKYGLSTDIVDQYTDSVHGRAVLKGGSTAAATCASCHGSHTALPPGADDIPKVCAQCHGDVEQTVRDSAHWGVAGPIGESPCEACHGHHSVQHPTMELLRTACADCHEPGSTGHQVSQELYDTVAHAMARYDEAEATLAALEEEGVHISDLVARMEAAHTANLEASRVQHALSQRKLEEKAVIVESIADDVLLTARHIQESLAVRRMILAGVWGFIGLTVLLLYWKKRRLEAREAEHAAARPGSGGEPV